jgi:hypothetical protein
MRRLGIVNCQPSASHPPRNIRRSCAVVGDPKKQSEAVTPEEGLQIVQLLLTLETKAERQDLLKMVEKYVEILKAKR